MLGPLDVLRNGQAVPLPPGRPTELLAHLLVHRNQVVSADRLVEELWGERAPASAAHAVQVHVSRLRTLLEPGRPRSAPAEVLITRSPGYLLAVTPDACDADRFVSLAHEGREALGRGAAHEAASILDQALRLWRGPALADLTDAPWALTETSRLEELRVVAIEERVEADLALGRHTALIPELETLVARHPFRETLWEQLMVALYRSGRQAEALRVFQRVHHLLGEELGLEPGPALRDLEARVLRHDPDLIPRQPVATSPATGRCSVSPFSVADADVEEQRVVSVLVARLAGGGVTTGAVDRMVATVEARGGVVLDRSSDGVAALFGAPIAYEDDPGRAVDTALALVTEMRAYGGQVDDELLTARVGVTTGHVAVTAGAPVGGDVLALATALRDEAPSGTVLVSAATIAHVRPQFDWTSIELSGSAASRGAAVCLARRTSGKVRGLEGREIPIIGRGRELDEAIASLEAAVNGIGGVLLITGDAGHGKSRFLGELRRRLEQHPSPKGRPLWLEGRCLSWGDALAYWPFREILAEWLAVSPAREGARARAILDMKANQLFGSDAGALAPLLAGVIGLPGDDADAPSVPPESIRAATFAALRSLFARLAADGPVVVAVDDLHWADPTSLALIDQLVAATDEAAILLVLALRPEREHASWTLREAALREYSHRTHEIVLGPLGGDVDAVMLDELVGPGVLPPAIARELLDVAEGNPLFIEELVRSLLESAALVVDAGGLRFERSVPLQLPTSVEHVLSSRIDHLPATARTVLGAAAVLGRQVDAEVLVHTYGHREAVTAELPRLERLRLISQVRRWPTTEYRFSHPMLAEVAQRRLLPDRRRELHRRAARAIETLFPERQTENAAELAYHYEHAGDIDRAVIHHRRAGDQARAVYALDEAVRSYSAAIDLLAGEGTSPSAAATHRSALHLGRGYAWWQLADARAADELRLALGLARNFGDVSTELETLEVLSVVEGLAEGDPAGGVDLLDQALRVAERSGDVAAEVALRNRVTVALVNRLDLRAALASGEAALSTAEAAGDERLVARALDGLKLVAFVGGDVARLQRWSAHLERLLTRNDDRRYLQYVLAESSFAWSASGDFDRARERLASAQALNDELGNRFDAPYLLTLRASLEATTGRYGQALRLARAAASAATEQANTQWVAWSEATLGVILLDVGAPAEALQHLDAARVAAERGGVKIQLVRALAHRALALQRLARAAAAEEVTADVDRAEQLLAGATAPVGHVVLHVLDAHLAVAAVRCEQGHLEVVGASLAPVLAAAHRAGWIEGMARAELALAQWSVLAGDAAAAAGSLQRALDASAGRLLSIEWQVRAARARLLHAEGDDRAAEAERRAARLMVKAITASFDDADAARAFGAWAKTVMEGHQGD